MDQISIQTIEDHIDVPLIAPGHICDLDAKEIASALSRLQEAVDEAEAEAEDVRDQDEDFRRLEAITTLIEIAMEDCEACSSKTPCPRHVAFKRWIDEG